MNLRDIKKDIEYVIGAFIDDCSLFSSVNSKADDEALGALLDEAVNLFNDLKDKVNMKGRKALTTLQSARNSSRRPTLCTPNSATSSRKPVPSSRLFYLIELSLELT